MGVTAGPFVYHCRPITPAASLLSQSSVDSGMSSCYANTPYPPPSYSVHSRPTGVTAASPMMTVAGDDTDMDCTSEVLSSLNINNGVSGGKSRLLAEGSLCESV